MSTGSIIRVSLYITVCNPTLWPRKCGTLSVHDHTIVPFLHRHSYRVFFLLVRPKNDQVPAPLGILRTGPPKKRLRMKKVKVPELFRTVSLPKMTKEKVQVTQLLW